MTDKGGFRTTVERHISLRIQEECPHTGNPGDDLYLEVTPKLLDDLRQLVLVVEQELLLARKE